LWRNIRHNQFEKFSFGTTNRNNVSR
jgi:hypothetical protein